jgi:hypothetical protein
MQRRSGPIAAIGGRVGSADLKAELALGVLSGPRGERLGRLRELVGGLDGDAQRRPAKQLRRR